MSPAALIERDRSHLVVVDLQERLLPAIHAGEAALRRACILVEAAGRLDVPVTVTEQYPRGLGPSVGPLREALPHEARIVEKITFAATGAPDFALRVAELRATGRDQVVVCGTEAHVCVLQTALGLKATGLDVFIAVDAVGSRVPESVTTATARLVQAGCVPVTTEMAVFEWLERAGSDTFRAVSALIK